MVSFISFIIVLLGSLNWLSIGMLQFDFVAGIFGSQANLFSRVIYVIIGAAAIWLVYAVIKQKGRIYVNSKKSKDGKLLSNIVSMGKDNKNKNDDEKYSQDLKDYNPDDQGTSHQNQYSDSHMRDNNNTSHNNNDTHNNNKVHSNNSSNKNNEINDDIDSDI